MARTFNNFEEIKVGGLFPKWEEGICKVSIIEHKEDVTKNGKDIDVFTIVNTAGAMGKLTLYYGERTTWQYKRLMAVCGIGVKNMTGNVAYDLNKLNGMGFLIDVKFEEYNGSKYPAFKIENTFADGSVFHAQREASENPTPAPENPESTLGMGEIVDDGDLPF